MISVNEAISIIKNKAQESDSLIVAVDGRCASGKTTLAKMLSDELSCNVIHIDDFFLRPEQRTAERLSTPGRNFDIERFTDEVIKGLQSKKGFSYKAFDCSKMELGEEIFAEKRPVTIIEGSYSCHPAIAKYWDVRLFVTTSKHTQTQRIMKRNPDKAEVFFSKWIPLEEKYFEHFAIEDEADYIITT